MARLLVENGSRTDVLFSGSLILKDHVTKQLISETSKAWEIHMETPLIAAIREGRTSIVALLIDNNVDVNFRCQSGMTALFAAILKGDKDIFEILLMGKLNVNQRFSNPKKIKIPINEGETPIELAHRLHRFEFEEALKNYDPDIIHIPQMMMPSFFDFLMKMDK
ncbi:hypothetical protein TVAG_487900 [Trichomonas vaginalis G3]|uniref:Uncharacterized protein n=1 Tax=Trichomonas vaginalis (strain ATCC PRA-98 / G3) TaxID=412133 RepID=A2E6I3_TRIV3|nr:Tre-2/BUB2p/Cdc16p domain-containing protein [Trichomonas vaginalis G3]EAY11688.1 hypothetical protein TVAG_487900 [Trichomonas vaginalis G3]KAI5488876.1 Tre-2/BUB2p/Cdc16p domain-containing protein [Trichomonas vaginalis G3]|eukprot:XP_001323911.1 hypothetical protein [Trichomonas vaginalis G3]